MKAVRKIIATSKGKGPITSPPLRVTADGSVRILANLSPRRTA